MKYAYDDFISKIEKRMVHELDYGGLTCLEDYLELVYVLKLYAKEFADDNLFDFAKSLDHKHTEYDSCTELIQNIKRQYKYYLSHRM